jgi:hypothetical protein
MSERMRPPERLRRAVIADLKPVKPLRSPGRRALEVALWGVFALLVTPAVFGIRHDAALLGIMLTWGAAVLEVVAGVLVVGLALREAVPGSGIGRRRAVAALVAGAAVQSAVALLTWMGGPPSAAAQAMSHSGAKCFAMQGMLGLPALMLTVFLVVQALPVRPPWAGALAGLGAGLLADGVWHLVCPVCTLRHLLLWHGAATATMVGVGFLLGVAWERRGTRQAGALVGERR